MRKHSNYFGRKFDRTKGRQDASSTGRMEDRTKDPQDIDEKRAINKKDD